MAANNHTVFAKPKNPNIKIWRYMGFVKFVSLLENSGLYLCRADLLGDPFEGATTSANVAWRKEFYKSIYADPNHPTTITFEEFERRSSHSRNATRQTIYINCWHMNEIESAAMWAQYTRANEAIAIQTSYSKLHSAVDDTCYIGTIKYIDYDKAIIPEDNLFWHFLHKRLSFSHEQELRVIKWEQVTIDKVWYPNPQQGYWARVDLGKLLESIFVSPNSPHWYYELVKSVVARFNLNVPVRQSSLEAAPLF